MGKVDNLKLQRYFDGELDAAEATAVEAALDDDDRVRLQAMGDLRALVNHALDAESESVDLWGGIEAALATEKKVADKRRANSRWRSLRARVAGAGLMAAAVAALLFVLRPGAALDNKCEVESLETEGAVATVMELDDEGKTTVIWTDETPWDDDGETEEN